MKTGLVGYPLDHSYSPEIHWLLGNEGYQLFPIDFNHFEEWILKKDFDGLNVTLPYKERIVPFLDELHEDAKKVGAVNTVVHRNNRLIGYNTDILGFEWLLHACGVEVQEKKIAILGTGGASKAICFVLEKLKATSYQLVSRSPQSNQISYEEFYQKGQEWQIVINTTPKGMYPNCDQSPVSLTQCHQLETLIDVVYNPPQTKLIQEAKERGVQTITGLGMVVAQAFFALELFEGHKRDDKEIYIALDILEKEKENFVFIGMPGAGKTTLAQLVGKELQKKVISIDEEIEKLTNKTIPQIFEEDGEEGFRRLEEKIVEQFHHETGVIFDCGGGIIKQKRVMQLLRYHGKIIWIQRNSESLQIGENRPLSQTVQDVERLYEERRELYRNYADVIVENNENLENVVEVLVDLLK